MIQTVIGINSAMMQMPDKKRKSKLPQKNMRIAVMTFRLRAEWVHRLKEKKNDSEKSHCQAAEQIPCFGSRG